MVEMRTTLEVIGKVSVELIVRIDASCDPLEHRAALELARSLTALTGRRWGVQRSLDGTGKCIVLGTEGRAEIDSLVAAAGIRDDLQWAGRDGYVIASVDKILLVAANTPQGALYGAFRAASLAGARFYLSRESTRHDLHCEAFSRENEPWPAFRLAERPRFAHRGALPWFNFLSGPTGWDREDWAVYVDNLARSRANMVGFHVYTGGLERYYPYVEPFVQIEAYGVLPEAELDTTETARWGYRPLSTQRFGAGTSLLFPQPVFGSEVAVPRGDLRSRYQRAQELLAWVMRRAKSWGISTFLGFEAGIVPPEVHSLIPGDARLASGELDPFHPVAERIFHQTLEHIVSTYPDLDALWLFQHEHVLFSQTRPAPNSALGSYCIRHQDAFPELPEESRWKGPWLLAWIESAWKWKERHAPHLKIAVSGWGGGNQFPRLIPGLDRTMPKDVVLTALIPGQGEGTLPDELAKVTGRERIAVPWWEGDAQLWHPQPRVESLLLQQDDFAAHGIAGTVGLHWRTQDIEANAWAFFESCWESRPQVSRSAAACYADYAAYGLGLATSDTAAEAGALLHRSEKEGWFRGAFSPVYFGYTTQWGRLRPEQRQTIENGLARLTELGKESHSQPSPAFEHLVHSWRFVLHLDSWSKAIEEAEAALQSGDAPSALRILSQAPAREALQAFAARVMTQGDRGALASVNQRVWHTHSALLARCADGLHHEASSASTQGPSDEGRPTGVQSDTHTRAHASAHAGAHDAAARGEWAVVLPTRACCNVLDDDRLVWRVLTGSLEAAAAFLVIDDGTNQRRFAMHHVAPGAFELALRAADFSWSTSDVINTSVQVLSFGSAKPAVPKGGEQTIVLFRGPGSQPSV